MPGLYGSVPAQGETYPGNAAVNLSGYELSLDKVVASVDGAPASLAQISYVPGYFQDQVLAKVTPTPQLGQTVVISGNFCADNGYYGDDYFCEPQSLSYVAGAHDLVAPQASLDVRYDVHTHPDREPSNSCENYSDATVYVRLKGTPAQPGESPVVVTVSVLGQVRQLILQQLEQTVTFELSDYELKGAQPEQLSVLLSVSDAAGNALGQSGASAACRLSKEAPVMDDGWSWSEPDWSKAQVVQGGPCWDDSMTPAGQPIVISSCSAASALGSSPMPTYLALLAAGLFVGLRRRQRRLR